MVQPLNIRGFLVHKGYVTPQEQANIVTSLREVAQVAPFFAPETARGRKMSVRMTSAGRVGWVTDRKGYRYEPHHPEGMGWPEIPEAILDIWRALVGEERLPDSCLVNYYGEGARMGMHQDKDEGDFRWPVVSLSLGDSGLFRMGNVEKGGKTESLWLDSGDVVVMGGEARLAYHGVDRIRFGSSSLLPKGGRINVTLRAVA